MFLAKPDSFPVLKGKAAELRHLPGPLLTVCEKFMDNAVKQHKQIILMLKLALEMETILDTHVGYYSLPGPVGQQFCRAAHGFVQLNTAIAHHFHAAHRMLFHYTIKFHCLVHLAEMSQYVSPRIGWCYSGEALMYRVRVLVQSSHRGLPSHAIADKVMKKYAYALGCTLTPEGLKKLTEKEGAGIVLIIWLQSSG